MGKTTYKMEVTVQIDESERQRLIDTARKYYGRSGGVSAIEDDETEVRVSPEEFIQSVDDALMELLHHHPGFKQAGIELEGIDCEAEVDPSSQDAESEGGEAEEASLDDFDDGLEDGADELDNFETGVYLCRWPNGEFSVITAASRREAILALDE
jgi:hypothetical protein